MMQIQCPYCGTRDEVEFSYGGEAAVTRPDPQADDAAWTNYLYFRNNRRGLHAERWRHTGGCGQWFTAVRNTASHEFHSVYRIGETIPADTDEVRR